MALRTLTAGPGERAGREPLFDVHPQTGATIEVFYADRALETFGRCGAGWFWWYRRRGSSPDGPATGPFATSYATYRDALTTGYFGGRLERTRPGGLRWEPRAIEFCPRKPKAPLARM